MRIKLAYGLKLDNKKKLLMYIPLSIIIWNKFVIKYTSYFLFLLKLEENPKLASIVSPPLALVVQMEHVL